MTEGGGGARISQNLCDVIYECPLISQSRHVKKKNFEALSSQDLILMSKSEFKLIVPGDGTF